jgi:hypothetical protein
MRTTTLITLAALLAATPLAAQTGAVAAGRVRAEVRIAAAITIPVYLNATETVAFTQTHKGEGFAEYLATYTVRGNAAWALEAVNAPAGVTVLDQHADWQPTAATIGTGFATNGDAILVRVRVAEGAAPDWKQALRVEAVRR